MLLPAEEEFAFLAILTPGAKNSAEGPSTLWAKSPAESRMVTPPEARATTTLESSHQAMLVGCHRPRNFFRCLAGICKTCMYVRVVSLEIK